MSDEESWRDFLKTKAGSHVNKEKGDYPNQISATDKIDIIAQEIQEIKTDTSNLADVIPEIYGDVNALETEGALQEEEGLGEELGMPEDDSEAYATLNEEDYTGENEDTTDEYSEEGDIDASAESMDGEEGGENGVAGKKPANNTSDTEMPLDTEADNTDDQIEGEDGFADEDEEGTEEVSKSMLNKVYNLVKRQDMRIKLLEKRIKSMKKMYAVYDDETKRIIGEYDSPYVALDVAQAEAKLRGGGTFIVDMDTDRQRWDSSEGIWKNKSSKYSGTRQAKYAVRKEDKEPLIAKRRDIPSDVTSGNRVTNYPPGSNKGGQQANIVKRTFERADQGTPFTIKVGAGADNSTSIRKMENTLDAMLVRQKGLL